MCPTSVPPRQYASTTEQLLQLHEKSTNILRLRLHCLQHGSKDSLPRLTEIYTKLQQQIFELTFKF